MTINVTATHANADYNSLLNDTPFTTTDSDFRICGDAANGYYAKARALGCGKDAASPEAAIRSLLMDNGYTNICLSYPDPEPTEEQLTERAVEMFRAGRDWAEALKPGDTFLGSHGEAWHRGLTDWDAKFFGAGALIVIETRSIIVKEGTNIIRAIEA